MTIKMQPRIEEIKKKKLVGSHLTITLTNNKTGELWRSFMPRRREIQNNLTNDLISLQIYTPTYFSDFNPANEFEKWALVEVPDFENVPDKMETFILPEGLYAVFDYRGPANDPAVFQHIFGTWLPESDYILDNRPHFEVLGEKYKNGDSDSEEEIWIPVKIRKLNNN